MKKYIIIILAVFLFSCGENTENELIETVETNEITFTQEQIDLAGIETDTISQKNISSKINCKGIIQATPQNRARVSVPMEGYIKNIYIQNGQEISKNKALITLEHPSYIELQKNYLQTKSQFEYMEIEYKRQDTLFKQGAVNAKVFEQTKSEHDALAAQLQAYKLQLQMLNIPTSNLTATNIRSSISVFAPISGTINNLNVTIGQYVQPDDVLFEVIDNDDFIIELHVFERDIQNIGIGQNIIFNCSNPNSSNVEHTAQIISIGNIVDDATKTFKVTANPIQCTKEMRHGMFINAEILIDDHLVYVLPEAAIVQDGGSFVFVEKSDNLFVKTPVETGLIDNGYVEIFNSNNFINKKIVVKGANYIKAEMEKE